MDPTQPQQTMTKPSTTDPTHEGNGVLGEVANTMSSLRRPKLKNNHVMTFGKYKGMTLGSIADEDPSYIIWLTDNNILDINVKLVSDCMGETMDDPDWMIGLEHEMSDD